MATIFHRRKKYYHFRGRKKNIRNYPPEVESSQTISIHSELLLESFGMLQECPEICFFDGGGCNFQHSAVPCLLLFKSTVRGLLAKRVLEGWTWQDHHHVKRCPMAKTLSWALKPTIMLSISSQSVGMLGKDDRPPSTTNRAFTLVTWLISKTGQSVDQSARGQNPCPTYSPPFYCRKETKLGLFQWRDSVHGRVGECLPETTLWGAHYIRGDIFQLTIMALAQLPHNFSHSLKEHLGNVGSAIRYDWETHLEQFCYTVTRHMHKPFPVHYSNLLI